MTTLAKMVAILSNKVSLVTATGICNAHYNVMVQNEENMLLVWTNKLVWTALAKNHPRIISY